MDRKEDCAKITAVYDGKGTEIEMEGTTQVLLVNRWNDCSERSYHNDERNMRLLAATKRVMHEMIDSLVNEGMERKSKENGERHATECR